MDTYTGISKEYNNRFVLTEERLRKIISILKDFALKNSFKNDLYFLLYTKSNTYTKTNNINDIFSQENGGDKENYALVLYFEKIITPKKREMIAKIKFYKFNNQIAFEVESSDRDQALILISDLEEQFERMKEKRRFYSIMSNKWIDILILAISMCLFTLLLFNYFDNIENMKYDKVLEEIKELTFDEKIAKLYITNVYSLSNIFTPIIAIISIMMLIYFEKSPVSNFFRKINRSFFVWNSEKESYNKFVNLETNIKWVVIIGFCVSFVSSIIFKLFF